MTFPDAIRGLIGNTNMLALLPGGPVLVMNRGGMVLDVRGGKARRYVGKAGDYLSIEWELRTREQMELIAKRMRAEFEAQQAAAQGVQDDKSGE